MNKRKLIILFLFFPGLVCLFLASPIKRENKKRLRFNGKITAIKYGEKGFVYVTLNNKVYSLGPVRNEFKQKVHVNDSLIKRAGEAYYFILTKNGEVLKF